MPRARAAGPASVPDGRARVFIERITPQVDNGRFPVKRVVGERVEVAADIFADGHDKIRAVAGVRFTPFGTDAKPGPWREEAMALVNNDLWTVNLEATHAGWLEYQVSAWIDYFESWRNELDKKHAAGLDVGSELTEGAHLIRARAAGARGGLLRRLQEAADQVDGPAGQAQRVERALAEDLAADMAIADDRREKVSSGVFRARVERLRARFGAWYEMFPRSETPDARSATFAEAARRLPGHRRDGLRRGLPAADPPDRPHGTARGGTTRPTAGPDDPGSPWAIGAAEGGHTAVDPGLGTLEDFDGSCDGGRAGRPRGGARHRLPVLAGSSLGARSTPSGSATGPTARSSTPRTRRRSTRTSTRSTSSAEAWQALWDGCSDVVAVLDRPRRADLPRRQPAHQAVRVLGVADRRGAAGASRTSSSSPRRSRGPKLMQRLAKGGFTQSYTYFTWRNTASRADRVLHRADADRGPRVPAAEPVRQHAGHPARVPAGRRAAGVSGAARAGRHARDRLRHLQRLRALREHAACAGLRGVPRLGEVPDPAARLGRRPAT